MQPVTTNNHGNTTAADILTNINKDQIVAKHIYILDGTKRESYFTAGELIKYMREPFINFPVPAPLTVQTACNIYNQYIF